MLTIKVKGLKELEEALKLFGPRLASRAGDNALRAGAKPIVDEAKRLVSVDTGKLKRSITAVVSSEGRKRDQRLVRVTFRKPRSRIAHLLEFGTSKMSARPFLRPAADARFTTVVSETKRVLTQAIPAVAAGVRKRPK